MTNNHMFNLGQYLHQLLHTHKAVGVPGIGIFSKERVVARYDEQSQSYLPPSFRYVLQPHAPVDRILIEEVAARQRITFDEARDQVDAVVEQLQNDITTQGEVQLDQVGYLKETAGAYELIAFDPIPYWGLTPITYPVQTTEITTAPTPAVIEEVPEVENDLIDTAPPQRNNLWFWMIALFVILGVASFWYIRSRNQNTPVPSVVQPPIHDSASTVAQQNNAAIVPDSAEQTKPSDSLTTDQVPSTAEAPLIQKYSKTHPYCIVLASFKTIDFAIKQAEYFRSIGIPAYVLESNMPNNRKKICYGRYVTTEAAKADLAKVRKEISKEAYIYPSE